MSDLEDAKRFSLNRPKAKAWNAMLTAVERTRLRLSVGSGRGAAMPHPWQVQANRWEDAPPSIEADRAWRIDIRAGWVNDVPAIIPYLRDGDPRGWVMPDGYPAPKNGDDGYDPRWVGRWLNEPEQTPFLTIEAPASGDNDPVGRAIVSSWERVRDRPDYFTEFYPEHLLFRATVLVTAAAVSAREFIPEVPAPNLGPYRVGCGRRPATEGRPVGGFLELAWVWLIREPERQDPTEDEMLVQQLVFYDLATKFVDDASAGTRWWTG